MVIFSNTYVYRNTHIFAMTINKKRGLEFEGECAVVFGMGRRREKHN